MGQLPLPCRLTPREEFAAVTSICPPFSPARAPVRVPRCRVGAAPLLPLEAECAEWCLFGLQRTGDVSYRSASSTSSTWYAGACLVCCKYVAVPELGCPRRDRSL